RPRGRQLHPQSVLGGHIGYLLRRPGVEPVAVVGVLHRDLLELWGEPAGQEGHRDGAARVPALTGPPYLAHCPDDARPGVAGRAGTRVEAEGVAAHHFEMLPLLPSSRALATASSLPQMLVTR